MSRFAGHQRFLLGLLACVCAGAALYHVVFAPLVQEYDEARTELAAREARFEQMQATLARLPELRSRRDELVMAMEELLRAIPAEAATDQLLAQLSGFATSAQARLLSLSVGELTPPEEDRRSQGQPGAASGSTASASPGAGARGVAGTPSAAARGAGTVRPVAPRPYLELPVEMTFLGSYPSIQQVLFDLRAWGRLVILNRLEIASDDQPTPGLTARLQGFAFSYARDAVAPGGMR